MEKLFAGLFDAHKLAHQDSQQYSWPESLNWEWGDRRAKIQTLTHEIAEQFREVTAVPSQGDVVKSPWFHRRVQCGRAIMTISSASSPDEVKPDCYFRKQYIQTAYRQLKLFEDEEAQLAPDDWIVYGLLLQGRGYAKPGELGFAVIRFPFRNADGYHECLIDLFEEFPHIVAMKRPRTDGQAGDEDLGIDFREGEDISP